jgi:transcriptional regulator of acetoin/glycerol metabolism
MSTIEERLSSIEAVLARIERVADLMLVKRPTLAEQAKLAGVDRSTLYRRRQREKLSQMVNGGTRRKSLSL